MQKQIIAQATFDKIMAQMVAKVKYPAQFGNRWTSSNVSGHQGPRRVHTNQR